MLELSIFTMREWFLHVKIPTEMNRMKSRLSSPSIPWDKIYPLDLMWKIAQAHDYAHVLVAGPSCSSIGSPSDKSEAKGKAARPFTG